MSKAITAGLILVGALAVGAVVYWRKPLRRLINSGITLLKEGAD